MLSSPAITELDVESSVYAVFAEWLADYFDGQPHDVGGNAAVPFPRALIQFGQAPMKQPLNPAAQGSKPKAQSPQAGIAMVWGAPVSTSRKWETVGGAAQLMIYKKVRWNFWVRAEMQASDTGSARKLCRQAAELLNALLMNPATTRDLGQCGIHHLRPGEPEPIADTGYILMLVGCRAQLRYPVFGTAAPDTSGSPAVAPYSPPNTCRVYTGSAAPNGLQTGNVGDEYNQIIDGQLVQKWTKVSGTGTNTGWQ
jgi:hypothetical protein